MAMQDWVRVGAAGALSLVIASCASSASSSPAPAGPSAAAQLTAEPSSTPAPSPIPSPPRRASPSPRPVVTPAASIAVASSRPRASTGPRGSASPDVAALIESYSSSFTATVGLLDLGEADLAVTVAYVDTSSPGQPQDLGTYTVGPSGQESHALPPGTYRLEFRLPPGGTTGPTCTIAVKKGDVFTFVAVPGAVAVRRSGFTPIKAGDLFTTTSPLCRKGR